MRRCSARCSLYRCKIKSRNILQWKKRKTTTTKNYNNEINEFFFLLFLSFWVLVAVRASAANGNAISIRRTECRGRGSPLPPTIEFGIYTSGETIFKLVPCFGLACSIKFLVKNANGMCQSVYPSSACSDLFSFFIWFVARVMRKEERNSQTAECMWRSFRWITIWSNIRVQCKLCEERDFFPIENQSGNSNIRVQWLAWINHTISAFYIHVSCSGIEIERVNNLLSCIAQWQWSANVHFSLLNLLRNENITENMNKCSILPDEKCKKKSSIFAFELRKQSIDHAICYIKFSSIFRNQPFLFSRHKCR